MTTDAQSRYNDSPFKFIGGDPSIDFVDTADYTARGIESDRFSSYERVIEWGMSGGFFSAADASALMKLAKQNPRRATRVHGAAVELRSTLEEILRALVEKRDPSGAIARLNEGILRDALRALSIVRDAKGGIALTWPAASRTLETPLHRVAWAAAQLLASPDIARLRRCPGPDCGWYYLDRSRNGFRRWCEMSECGTKVKSLKRAERRHSAE
ncbi:MAG: CGNR zinc finger domain-containing protein [bacterium]